MNKSKLFLLISRYILGAIILIFGFNEYHNLIPIQQTGTEELNALIGGLKSTGYLYYAVKIVEFTAGVLLVGGFFVPFANLMLFPVLLNIFLAYSTTFTPSSATYACTQRPGNSLALQLF